MAIKDHRTVIDTDSVALQPQIIGSENLLTDRVIKIRTSDHNKTKPFFHNTDSM